MFRIFFAAGAAALCAASALAQAGSQQSAHDSTLTVAQPSYGSADAVTRGRVGQGPGDGLEACGPAVAASHPELAAASPGGQPARSGATQVAFDAATGSVARSAAVADDAPDFTRIRDVTCAAGALPDGQSAITAKVQTLLDRANVSPGVIDGWRGGMTASAIRDFETREGLPADGEMDPQVWAALSPVRGAPVTRSYTITEADADVMGDLPYDYSEKAKLDRLGYQRVTERLAKRFHMDEEFLRTLNPGAAFRPGDEITVMAPGAPAVGHVVRIRIDKSRQRLFALGAAGDTIASYPVTIGSDENPSPSGTHEVNLVQHDPLYHYSPETFVQADNYQELTLPSGPNNPVGVVWIDLSKPGYGIHGTPRPAKLFRWESHGCVRMTNWDAEALAAMVEEGTSVEFVE